MVCSKEALKVPGFFRKHLKSWGSITHTMVLVFLPEQQHKEINSYITQKTTLQRVGSFNDNHEKDVDSWFEVLFNNS